MSISEQVRPVTSDDAPDDPGRGTRIVVTLVVAATSTLVIWAVAPEAVSATFSGPGPFLRVCAVIVGFVVLSAVVRRLIPNPWVARAVIAVPAIAVTWWALSPYIGDDVVNEDFPVVADTAPTDDAAAPIDDDAATEGQPTDGDDGPAVDDQAPPPSSDAGETSAPAPDAEPPPSPTEPVALASGGFQGLTGHRGAGNATIYELPDGSRVVRLEDFDVSNGPGLEIHLVPGADQRGPGGGVRLDDLKGNVGNQNYDVPPDLDLDGDWTVLIWCEPFTVEVANATASFG